MEELIILVLILYCMYAFGNQFTKIEYQKFKNNKPVGDIGEKIVKSRLDRLSDEFVVSHDVYFGNAQIDHLVVSHEKNIIFVIETKMWGGIITGECNDAKWEQNKGGQIKYLDNPMMQNKYHCRVVRKYYPDYKVYNVVVFVRNTNVPNYPSVMNENNLVDYIYRVSKKVSNRVIIGV
jgi:hypothetical protein